jgi:phosphoribosylanthranilate isomerase
MRTWIKICGTTCIEDALASVEAGADAVGFVFAPSKRRVPVEQASQISAQLPENIGRIGVFSGEQVHRIVHVVEEAGLTGVQLHGGEAPEFIDELRRNLAPDRGISVIKAILVNDDFEARRAEAWSQRDGIDFILLDSGGGTGRTFDWRKAQPFLVKNHKRVIVAGGLHCGNVEEAIRELSPWGVDVVSGVERESGRKDSEKLKAFVATVRRLEP